MALPPLPAGFTLDSGTPPLPAGFTLDQPRSNLRADNPAEYDPTSPQYQAKYGAASGGTLQNIGAGAGKFFNDIGMGVGQKLGLVDEADVAEDRRLAAPLMATKAGKAGYIGGGLAATVPLIAVPGANTVAGAALTGGALGAAQPTVEGESSLKNAALGAALGGVGQKVGTVAGNYATRKIAERTAAKASEQADNVVRDATLRQAQEAGYVIPPSSATPSLMNRTLEGVSGKVATQQSAAFRNQRVTNRLIREDLGMKPGTPITKNALQNIRTLQGQVYKDIKDSGQIVADSRYFVSLGQLTRSADEIAADFPGMNLAGSAEVKALEKSLMRDSFSANSAVELMKQLRANAADNLSFTVTDPKLKALGLAQREAAEIVEEQVMRHLNSIGRKDLANTFDKARTRIAKTYTVQGALNEATGNVNATQLTRQLKRGKYLDGGIEKAAKFGGAFPKAAREELTSPGVSALDWMVGLGGPMTGNPATVALPAARMAARGAVLSGPYQRAFTLPKYLPKTRLLRGLGAGSEFAPAAGVLIPGYVQQEEAL